jgi:hypothetical protein
MTPSEFHNLKRAPRVMFKLRDDLYAEHCCPVDADISVVEIFFNHYSFVFGGEISESDKPSIHLIQTVEGNWCPIINPKAFNCRR